MRLYAVTIFLSAFLLFQVQPLIAKIILPWSGGSAAVWSASLLFFQLLLLAGYAYAHLSIRFLGSRAQMRIHVALLMASCAMLPILPSASWRSPVEDDPTVRILMILGTTVGLPYFLLAATSPLLQAWYARRTGAGMPYRLFALSNLGSLLALVSFPFLVEPLLASSSQVLVWSAAYALFAVLCAYTAWAGRAAVPGSVITADVNAYVAGPVTPTVPGFVVRAFWVLLAACASVLLMAVTNHITRNVAPIPLLWVLPLALYLLTFIVAFESDRLYRRWLFLPLLPVALGGMAYLIYASEDDLNIIWSIPVFAAGLFIACMVCHGELARRRPSAQHLTLFYLMVSLGGALGGFFVALVAPRIFSSYIELPWGLVMCGMLGLIAAWRILSGPKAQMLRLGSVLAVVLLAVYTFQQERTITKDSVLRVRNFYGALRVQDDTLMENIAVRTLVNGTVEHGSQLLETALRNSPTSYYGEFSGVGRALRAKRKRGPVRVGVIGLGAGVLAHYGRAGDHFTFYELDPLNATIARSLFTFYSGSAAEQRIIMGDGRLSLEAQQDQDFDLIAVDAFSGDAIPVHLLTHEATELYMRHLAPDGILAFHISNRYLDLVPVCAGNARAVGLEAMVIDDDASTAPWYSPSTWVLITEDTAIFHDRAFRVTVAATPDPASNRPPDFSAGEPYAAKMPDGFRPWTDDYSNLFQVLAIDQ
ncbi:MAG TPA: fused MFS/spermidine synthase [Flavobacteriales bacterium]|nr:fused MFS/spermidine synthase [Flavobacteriales bacterium]